MAVDLSGNIYIADTGNGIIRMVTKSNGIISTVAGIPKKHGNSGDGGPATSALLDNPLKVIATNDGTFYIADSYSNTIRTFTVAPSATPVVVSSATPDVRHVTSSLLGHPLSWIMISLIFVVW